MAGGVLEINVKQQKNPSQLRYSRLNNTTTEYIMHSRDFGLLHRRRALIVYNDSDLPDSCVSPEHTVINRQVNERMGEISNLTNPISKQEYEVWILV